jgi:hypothetical protein
VVRRGERNGKMERSEKRRRRVVRIGREKSRSREE